MTVMPGALALISSTHNLAWFMHLLPEFGRQQVDQKIKVTRVYMCHCLKTRDLSLTSTAHAHGSLNN